MRISEIMASLQDFKDEYGDCFVEYGEGADSGLTVSDVYTVISENVTIVVLD